MNSLHSSALCLALACAPALAGEPQLIGIGRDAAILSVDGGEPKTVKVGQKWNGISVVTVDRTQNQAVVEYEGKRRTLTLGQHYRSGNPAAGGRKSAILLADSRGHFITEGTVNGGQVRFLVDTGASVVALPRKDAVRLGLDYSKGQKGFAQTANGPALAYRVKLDSVRIGDIELTNVDGVVLEQGLEFALLGMTFLNRVEMLRDGETMTLTRRF